MSNETMSAADVLSMLDDAVMHDGGTCYSGDEDEIGCRACCNVLSYEPHAADCWMGEMPRIRAYVAALIAERDALEERVKALEEALQAIERRTFRHPEDAADDHRRNLFHAHSIAKAALARAEADNG